MLISGHFTLRCETRLPAMPSPDIHRGRNIPRLTAVFCGLLLLTATGARAAGQAAVQGYDEIAAGAFWAELYRDGGWTLYCGEQFGMDRKTVAGKIVGIDHVYSIDAMLRFLGCRTRLECRERPDGRFARMEADMHNLYPEWQTLVLYRNGRAFGVVQGEDWRFDDCDVEWGNGVFEPRPIARGNVARSLLYMHDTYRVPLDAATRRMLQSWHRDDPPSRQERLRNDAIQKLQGRRNPWIDRPARQDRQNVAAD
jgi:deoxyribonuclease-1